jgi:hypothetical protein
MPAAITQPPLVVIKEISDPCGIPIALEQPLFVLKTTKKWETEIFLLLGKLELLLQQQGQTSNKQDFNNDISKIIGDINNIWLKDGQRRASGGSLQAYIALKPETISFYPLALAAFGLAVNNSGSEVDMQGY